MEILSQINSETSLVLLFSLSFLAATVIPIGSEWLLVLMLLNGNSPQQAVLIATFGNYLGACTTYGLGILGSDTIISKFLRIDAKQKQKAEEMYHRYGTWSLLLSWVPIVGDPICLVGGIFRIHFIRFSLLVFLGKFCRYATLALLVVNKTGG